MCAAGPALNSLLTRIRILLYEYIYTVDKFLPKTSKNFLEKPL